MKPFDHKRMSADADKAREKKAKFHSSWMLHVINFLLQLDFFYCLLLTGFYVQAVMKKGLFEPLRYVGMLLFFAALYGISRVTARLYLIIALDLAVIVVAGIFYPLPYSKIWLIAALLIFALIDILIKGEPGDRERTIVWFAENSAYWGVGIGILCIVSAIVGYGRSISRQLVSCAHLELIILCIFLAEYFVQRYVFLIYDHYHKVKKMDTVDLQHVKRVTLFAVVVGAGIAICLYLFSGVFARLGTWIMTLFTGGNAQKIVEEIRETAKPPEALDGISRIAGNSNRLLRHIGPRISLVFTNKIVKVAAFAIILFGLLALYRWLCRSRYMHENTEDVVTVIEKKKSAAGTQKGTLSQLRYGNSNNEQIRRMFRRFVLGRLPKKKYEIRHMTAEEIADLLGRTGVAGEQAAEMADLYAFARYSGKTADAGQVQRMRSLCRETGKE